MDQQGAYDPVPDRDQSEERYNLLLAVIRLLPFSAQGMKEQPGQDEGINQVIDSNRRKKGADMKLVIPGLRVGIQKAHEDAGKEYTGL